MINGIDFSMDYSIQITLVACLFFPFLLMILARIPKFTGRNAAQFFLSFIMTTLGWIIALGLLITKNSSGFGWASFFLYGALMLIYLEIWGLLSRGYTIGLLLTFYKAKKSLTAEELANLYRGGHGLDWLIKHRFAGLISTKLIKLHDNKVTLTIRGRIVAFLYKLSVLFLGLRYSG